VVTEEVLPTIRKTVRYDAEQSTNPIEQGVMDELKALRQYFAGLKAFLLQAEGVPAAFAQAIIGHSQTVAYDAYGSGVPVAIWQRFSKASGHLMAHLLREHYDERSLYPTEVEMPFSAKLYITDYIIRRYQRHFRENWRDP
jgi:hypothetical protein